MTSTDVIGCSCRAPSPSTRGRASNLGLGSAEGSLLWPLAISWGNKIYVDVQTPVWTTYPTTELKTPCTMNENLNIEPLLLDGGQGKEIVCNITHPKNLTVLEGTRKTLSIGDTVEWSNDKISTPVDEKNQ